MKIYLDSLDTYYSIKHEQEKPKKDYAGIGAIIFTFTVLSIVIGLSIYTSYQILYGQEVNETETANTKVDKLIEDTKRENATEESYRAELIQRMQNTTCLNTNLEGIGSVPLNTDILKTSELEDLLKTCVKEGLIK